MHEVKKIMHKNQTGISSSNTNLKTKGLHKSAVKPQSFVKVVGEQAWMHHTRALWNNQNTSAYQSS